LLTAISVEPGAPARTHDLLVPRSKPTSTTFDLVAAGAREGVSRLIGWGGFEPNGEGVATEDVLSSDAVGIVMMGWLTDLG